ncbi:MAG: N-acetylmuramoyl-L-alanine amidase [Eggerthellaceae bacterium]|nr:N-acetylmuramoyl-L-alanine amidase [Eggerthellaceae bacterium]
MSYSSTVKALIAVSVLFAATCVMGALAIQHTAQTITPTPQNNPSFEDIEDKPLDLPEEDPVYVPRFDLEALGFSITEYLKPTLGHGDKPAQYQSYIMIHDTESAGFAREVIAYWARSGAGVASHFVIDKDGEILQCLPMDVIAHHAGYGDAGNNLKFNTPETSRDDKIGATPIGDRFPDYGMNAYSIGIELCHQANQPYTQAQLQSLDLLICYIDSHYGFESVIIDHKMWRASNSDTSAAFAPYLANYIDHRTHD